MPVIITDMAMPASCAWCDFGQRIDNDHTMCLRHPMGIPNPDTDGRPSHCPLKEVKIGKWVEQDGYDGDIYYDCSVCGESWVTIDGTPQENRMFYCPHCGAKMET